MAESNMSHALLDEARSIFQLLEALDLYRHPTYLEHNAAPPLIQRIRYLQQQLDAALAEPVGECKLCAVSNALHEVAVSQRDGNAYLLAEVERERDEARAARNHFQDQLRERANALLTAREEAERLTLAHSHAQRDVARYRKALLAISMLSDASPRPDLALQNCAKLATATLYESS